MEQDLTLREALAADRLDDFVQQGVAVGAELVNGSEIERALALLITQHRRAGIATFRQRAHSSTKVAQNVRTSVSPSCEHPVASRACSPSRAILPEAAKVYR